MSQSKQIVLVEWEDAASASQWLKIERAIKPDRHICHTAGVLLEKNSKLVIVALSYCELTGTAADVMQIPRGMVRSIKRVGSFKP